MHAPFIEKLSHRKNCHIENGPGRLPSTCTSNLEPTSQVLTTEAIPESISEKQYLEVCISDRTVTFSTSLLINVKIALREKQI